MPRRIVDISVALTAGIASDPPYMLPQISYVDHKAGADNFSPSVRRAPLTSYPTAPVRRSRTFRSRPTTARISMRRITSIRPRTAASLR